MAYKFDPNDQTTNISDNIVFIGFETTRKNVGDLGMKTIQVMAYEGISEEKELIRAVSDVILFSTGQLVSDDSIRKSVERLRLNGLIKEKVVNTGVRRFKILKLLSNGYLFVKHFFRKDPVESEWEIIEREHASVEHGYLIKDTKKILEEKGIYDTVTTGRTENRIVISEKHACIPDIVGVREDKRECYEVECGTHNQKEFNYKCSKLANVTSNILFVSQNREVLKKKIVKQVEHWIGKVGREKLKELGIKVYLTTLKDLQNDKWTYCYGLETSEPQCNCPIVWEKKGGDS